MPDWDQAGPSGGGGGESLTSTPIPNQNPVGPGGDVIFPANNGRRSQTAPPEASLSPAQQNEPDDLSLTGDSLPSILEPLSPVLSDLSGLEGHLSLIHI